MLINLTRYPLSDRNFRRAMACAINYTEIKDLAISGYTPEIKPGLIMPYGIEKRIFFR